MQLRLSVLAIAAVLTCSTLHQTVACTFESESRSLLPLASEPRAVLSDVEDESIASYVRELAAGTPSAEVSAFSADVEDESVPSYVRELSAVAARRDMIAAMEAIDTATDVADRRSFPIDVEDESVSSNARDLALIGALHTVRELQPIDTLAGPEAEGGLVAPAFWGNDNEFPGAEEDATGSTPTEPLTESIALDGHEDR